MKKLLIGAAVVTGMVAPAIFASMQSGSGSMRPPEPPREKKEMSQSDEMRGPREFKGSGVASFSGDIRKLEDRMMGSGGMQKREDRMMNPMGSGNIRKPEDRMGSTSKSGSGAMRKPEDRMMGSGMLKPEDRKGPAAMNGTGGMRKPEDRMMGRGGVMGSGMLRKSDDKRSSGAIRISDDFMKGSGGIRLPEIKKLSDLKGSGSASLSGKILVPKKIEDKKGSGSVSGTGTNQGSGVTGVVRMCMKEVISGFNTEKKTIAETYKQKIRDVIKSTGTGAAVSGEKALIVEAVNALKKEYIAEITKLRDAYILKQRACIAQ